MSDCRSMRPEPSFRSTWALALAAVWALPASASASSAVLLPALGGDAVAAETQSEARRIARDVLSGEGFTVFDALEIRRELPPELRTCGPQDRCGFSLRALLEVDLAVGVSLHLAHGARVGVVVTGARGVAHRAEALVDPEAGLPFAIAEAIRGALTAWTAGRSLESTPELAPEPGRMATHLEPSLLNAFLGGFLILGSAPMLGYGINSAARDGECIREGAFGGCTQRVRFQEGAALFTAVGAATLAAGVAFLVFHPIPVLVSADGTSASLHARGTF